MQEVLNYILGLGAAVFLPIIMIVLGLAMRMKAKRAVLAGLTLGIAFTGMNVVLGFMFNAISPAATALVERTGLQLTAIDVGWAPVAAIAWAWPFALVMFPLQIGINLLMLGLKWTNCLNVDLWNVWGKIFTASMVAYITDSIVLGFVAAAVQVVLELISGDLVQKRCFAATKIPGVTCTHPMFLQGPVLALINRGLDFIPGINKSNINVQGLKDRIGIFGENSVMGFIVGGLIAILGGYDLKGVVTTAVGVATAMVLFPLVAKLFMQALAPIADAAGAFMKSKFKGRDFYIGLDWPFMAGCPEIWVTAIVLVPIELVLAVVMSHMGLNNLIPLASIINIVLTPPAMIIAKGNLVRMILISAVATPMYLAVGTSFAPLITKMAADTNTLQVQSGQLISWMQLEAPELRWSLAHAFNGELSGVLALTAFLVVFVWYFKSMRSSNALSSDKK